MNRGLALSFTTSGGSGENEYTGSDDLSRLMKEARILIATLADSQLRDNTTKITSAIEHALTNVSIPKETIRAIPPIRAWREDDNSVWLEFATEDIRVGVIVEGKFEESQWFKVTSRRLQSESSFAYMSKDSFQTNIDELISAFSANI